MSEETAQLLSRLLCPNMRSARCTILPLTDDHRVSAPIHPLAETCMKCPVRRRTDPDEVRVRILKGGGGAIRGRADLADAPNWPA
jgi:hypothetical protein